MLACDSIQKVLFMLRDQLTEAMKTAMREKAKARLGTIRLVLAAVKERDIAARIEDASEADDDAVILGILSKMVKQRNDSIKAYEDGGRLELAEAEREEITIIQEFLPKQLSDDEVAAAAKAAVAEVGAEGLKDMGKTIGALKAKYEGQMDFAKASKLLKELLS
jgi:hypothetical protein